MALSSPAPAPSPAPAFPAPVEFPPPSPYSPSPYSPAPYSAAPEYSAGAAAVPTPPPAFSAPDAGYSSSAQQGYGPPSYAPPGYPVTSQPASGYGGYGGYGTQPGYGAQPGYGVPPPGYPVYAPAPKTNGLAIASMVVSIVGVVFLVCYGVGVLISPVGAILGHVSRRQIRERQEGGDGMALAGVITGWIGTGLGLAIIGVIVFAIVVAANAS